MKKTLILAFLLIAGNICFSQICYYPTLKARLSNFIEPRMMVKTISNSPILFIHDGRSEHTCVNDYYATGFVLEIINADGKSISVMSGEGNKINREQISIIKQLTAGARLLFREIEAMNKQGGQAAVEPLTITIKEAPVLVSTR